MRTQEKRFQMNPNQGRELISALQSIKTILAQIAAELKRWNDAKIAK